LLKEIDLETSFYPVTFTKYTTQNFDQYEAFN